nr:hypothetical protein B0A51_02001 [Rachicladosporium sp. CCFEE 5018]
MLRRNMWAWFNGPGKAFREPLAGSTNYLTAYDKTGNLRRAKGQGRDGPRQVRQEKPMPDEDEVLQQEEEDGIDEVERAERAQVRATERQERAARESATPKERASDLQPYPLNPNFKSQPVLSEELREKVYEQIVLNKMDLQSVSAAWGIDMRRVAAVVRLKTIEKQWEEEGRKLARPYSKAVLEMLPKTPVARKGEKVTPHESINDLPVHPATRQQLFYPASESRAFTREDAAKAFSPTLLPADKRIPHTQLLQLEKWSVEGVPREERINRFVELERGQSAEKAEKERKKAAWEERTQRVVAGRRWDFKFQDVSVESVGRDGRSPKGVGYRYGIPHTDRKSGEVKIPTSVE